MKRIIIVLAIGLVIGSFIGYFYGSYQANTSAKFKNSDLMDLDVRRLAPANNSTTTEILETDITRDFPDFKIAPLPSKRQQQLDYSNPERQGMLQDIFATVSNGSAWCALQKSPKDCNYVSSIFSLRSGEEFTFEGEKVKVEQIKLIDEYWTTQAKISISGKEYIVQTSPAYGNMILNKYKLEGGNMYVYVLTVGREFVTMMASGKGG